MHAEQRLMLMIIRGGWNDGGCDGDGDADGRCEERIVEKSDWRAKKLGGRKAGAGSWVRGV
jgi:hypothetical protein